MKYKALYHYLQSKNIITLLYRLDLLQILVFGTSNWTIIWTKVDDLIFLSRELCETHNTTVLYIVIYCHQTIN